VVWPQHDMPTIHNMPADYNTWSWSQPDFSSCVVLLTCMYEQTYMLIITWCWTCHVVDMHVHVRTCTPRRVSSIQCVTVRDDPPPTRCLHLRCAHHYHNLSRRREVQTGQREGFIYNSQEARFTQHANRKIPTREPIHEVRTTGQCAFVVIVPCKCEGEICIYT
jgi:hypothetical protein